MTETTAQPTDASTETSEVAPTRLQRFVTNHPRISKITAITGAVAAVVGVATVARTVRSNKDHLENAADHVSAAGSELAATVDPMSPEA